MDREEAETKQTATVSSSEGDDSREKPAATEEPASPGAFQALRNLLEKRAVISRVPRVAESSVAIRASLSCCLRARRSLFS